MFRDDFYFMTPAELNSYNRVMGAPGCAYPTAQDQQRYDNMMDKVGDPAILRTESGVYPYSE